MSLRIEIGADLSTIDAAQWDALTGEDDPFVEHAFLLGLEQSKSVGEGTGWLPLHVVAKENDAIVGALPLYAKGDSWGEFIFDFAWAHAARRAGIRYYPKLVAMVPFTPATGRRLLVRDGVDDDVRLALLAAAREATTQCGASSLHVLFLSDEERALAEQSNLQMRLSLQFHWHNQGYASFDDYLASFRSEKRKQVKRERRRAKESGLDLRAIRGTDLEPREWSDIARLYRDGCVRHGSHPYLTRELFEHLREHHAHRVVAFVAKRAEKIVAMSLCFEKGAHLYGRYWGCDEAHEMLHFELCYYMPIEHSITTKKRRFEAGAQGIHKLGRGLMPARIHSAHWMRDSRLDDALGPFLQEEASEVEMEIAALGNHGPFHRD